MRLAVLAAVVVLSQAGATTAATHSSIRSGAPTAVTGAFIRAPVGDYLSDPVWIPDRRGLIVSGRPGNLLGSRDAQLLFRTFPEGRWQRFSVPDDPACPMTSNTDAQQIGETRIALLQHCWGNDARMPDRAVRPVVVNWRSQSASLLRPYFLPYTTSALTAAAGGSIAIVNDGLGLEEHLWRLGSHGRTRFGPTFLRAGRPAISPAGTELAVAGVPTRRNAPSGLGRADLPWNLYIVPVRPHARARLLAAGYTSIGRPSWSPDGRWLAVVMTAPRSQPAIWLLNVHSGRLTRLLKLPNATGTTWITQSLIAATVGRIKLARTGSAGISGVQVIRVRTSAG